MLEIKKMTFSEISSLPEFKQLTDEYSEGVYNVDVPKGKVDYDTYRKYEAVDILRVYGGFLDSKLIGFLFLVVMLYPHRSFKMTVQECVFVTAAQRHTGMGLRLIKKAEEVAEETESFGNIFYTPVGHILDDTLPRLGYTKIQHIYFKERKCTA